MSFGAWVKLCCVLVLLCCCYFGKYFCSSDMYIANTLFVEEEGFTAKTLSSMFALGYFASIFGKLAAGALCDAIGGRFVIILSASGYVGCTFLLSIVPSGPEHHLQIFLVWAGIGFFALGLAWVAIVAVATNWIPRPYLGRLMGLVSMAPQLGDAIARLTLAPLLDFGWRAVFRAASLWGLGLLAPVALFIPNAPASSLAEQTEGPSTPYSPTTPVEKFDNYLSKLRILVVNPFLWFLCLLSGSLYGTRTLFLLYSTSFLTQVYCQDADDFDHCVHSGKAMRATAMASSGYTILGCFSVLIVGMMRDKLPNRHRGAILTVFCAPLFGCLAYLMTMGLSLPYNLAVVMVWLIGFCLFGPYKILGAVFAVDVGGKELKSTCTGLMGVSDNLFAILMLLGKGYIGDDWGKMFSVLAGLSFISLGSAAAVWRRDLNIIRKAGGHRQNSLALLGNH